MPIGPILAALRRNKAGAILIGLQLALTLAIVCNALFIIVQRLGYIGRPSGVDEASLFVVRNIWVGRTGNDAATLIPSDLATIRATPGVANVYATNSFPLSGGGWSTGLNLMPGQEKSTAQTTVYAADDQTLDTLGVRLVAGRNFRPDEVTDYVPDTKMAPPVIIVTQDLASKLFPDGSALGKAVYMGGKTSPPSTIIGIVDRLQTPWVGSSWSDKFFLRTTLVPHRMLNPSANFVVRALPGQRDAAIKAVAEQLFKTDRLRLIPWTRGYDDIRQRAYKKDRGMATLMTIVCTALLLVTAAGIVGLASFWVGQRHRQIGIRRALGATRGDILRYFQTENLLIAGVGVVVGVIAATALNVWLVTHYEMARLSWLYLLSGAVVIVVLGQLAVLQPALRASRVPPVAATRAA